MHEAIGRVFLVGCSRSGTTVLQHHLARHTAIHSLPETDFFGRLFGNAVWRTIGRLGRVRASKARRALDKLRQTTQRDTRNIPGVMPKTEACVAEFVRCLDERTRASGKRVWLEKTPKHYRYVGEIHRFIPDAHVIHMVRDGRDVVASIRDQAIRFPEEFGHQADPVYGVKLWNRAIREALRRATQGTDTVVLYEDFVAPPTTVLERVCDVLSVPFEAGMLTSRGDTADIAGSDEPWEANVGGGLRDAPSKFGTVFSQQERDWIKSRLDWSTYARLQELSSLHGNRQD